MDILDPLRTGLLSALRPALAVGDGPVERLLGAPYPRRLLAGALARSYDPTVVRGFDGSIAIELTRPVTGGEPLPFVLVVRDGRARAHTGAAAGREPATLRLELPLADFARIATGAIDPVEPLLNGRAQAEGDLALAARLAEMFGAPPRR